MTFDSVIADLKKTMIRNNRITLLLDIGMLLITAIMSWMTAQKEF